MVKWSGRVPPFLGDEVAEKDLERAGVAILQAPYEASVCWGDGTARGPEAILRASPHLEFYDEQLRLEPYRTGIDDGDATSTWLHYRLRVFGEQDTRDLYVRFNGDRTVKSYSFNSNFPGDHEKSRR